MTTKDLERKRRLARTVQSNPGLHEVASNLKKLHSMGVDCNKVIQDMKLPLRQHMFITANFTDLMSLDYK